MDLLYWFVPWEGSLTVVVATGIAAILFFRGCAIGKPQLRQKIYFWTGLASLYFVSHTQFDYYSEHQFFIHRLQHLVLHHLGPFLIVLSHPLSILLSGMSVKGRQWWSLAAQWKPLRYLANISCNPVVAVTLFCGLIGFWLLPSIHFTAMIDWRLYRLMNWTMLINGLMFWALVLNSRPIFSTHLSPGIRIAMMFAVVPPQIVLGALIFFASRELYPIYTICGRAIGGLSAIGDQQVGGIILWIHGAMMSVAGILIVVSKEVMPRKLLTKHRVS